VKTVSSIGDGTQPFSESIWYHALTLTERIESLRNSYDGVERCPSDRLTQATKRLEQWKNQHAFSNSDLFAERLAMDAITEQELLMLLAEPIENLQKRFMEHAKPEWISKLQHIWETYSLWNENESDQGQDNASALLNVLGPFIGPGSGLLRQGIERFANTSQKLPLIRPLCTISSSLISGNVCNRWLHAHLSWKCILRA